MKLRCALPLVLFGSLWSACATSVSWSEWGREVAERTITGVLPVEAGGALDVASRFGSVTVAVKDSGPRVVARIRAHGESVEEAAARAAAIELAVGQDGESTTLRVHRSDGEELQQCEVAFEITIPERCSVRVRVAGGSTSIAGPVGGCDVESEFGGIRVEDVTGSVRAVTRSGAVEVRRVDGGAVQVESQFGAVTLGDVAASKVAVLTRSGEIAARGIRAEDVALETMFGAVRVDDCRGALRAETRSGTVKLRALDGPRVSATSQFGAVEVEGVLRVVDARTASGDVGVRARPGSSCAAPWAIATHFGDVDVAVPDDFGAELRLSTGYGSITTDVPLTITRGDLRGAGPVLARIGAGGPAVTIESRSGSVRLQRVGD